TNTAGAAATITATAGTPQSATVNTAFGTAFQATGKERFRNPVSGVTVTFGAPGSGASAVPTSADPTTTNTSGIATITGNANTIAGSYTVTATAAGVATPANFSVTNTAGAAATISATGGTPQSTTVNTAFGTAFQAT